MTPGSARPVVVLGSVNVDYIVTLDHLPRPGETVGNGILRIHQGGKGANQAVAAAQFGACTHLVGVVGDDVAGDAALTALIEVGVGTDHVRRDRVPTGTALIMVNRQGTNVIAVAPGANQFVVASDSATLLEAETGVFVSGFEVPLDEAVLAILAAQHRGWTTILNPAPAVPIPDALRGSGLLIVPNETELRTLTCLDEEEDAARALARWAGAPVVVTLGERGALIVDDKETIRVFAPRVEAVDTTGAGDVFIGVMAGALAGAHELLTAVQYGVAAASVSVTIRGARAPVPKHTRLDEVVAAAARSSIAGPHC